MQLPILNGLIYPTAFPDTDGQETIYVTPEQHAIIFEDWSAEEPKAYRSDGEQVALTAAVLKKVDKALSSSPAMIAVIKMSEALEKSQQEAREKVRAGIGKAKKEETPGKSSKSSK